MLGIALCSIGFFPLTVQVEKPGARTYISADSLTGRSRSYNAPPTRIDTEGLTRLELPPGFESNVFAVGLRSPRSLAVSPNGDVFCVESYQGRIQVLRDSNGTGRANEFSTFAAGLKLPFGIAFHGGFLYVANTDSVVRFRYRNGQLRALGRPETVVSGLPFGGRKNHWTRNLAFSPDGNTMFVTVGSETNNALEKPPRGTILRFNLKGSERRIFANGLRNPVGIAFDSQGEMWVTNVERDFLGNDYVPDFITRVREGDDFGWPIYTIGSKRDPRHLSITTPRRASRIPDVLVQAHSTPLGAIFYRGTNFPPEYRDDLFVALRGSTNRVPRSGYKIVRVDFRNGKTDGSYFDFAQGWIPDRKQGLVHGRPVGLAVAQDGSMLVADEAGHRIWRIRYQDKG